MADEPRYTVEGMEQILGAMMFAGHIRAWDRDVEPWGNEIFISGPIIDGDEYSGVTESWTFPEDWLRAEFVKMDMTQPNHDEIYVVLMHSARIPEMLTIMQTRYEKSREVVS